MVQRRSAQLTLAQVVLFGVVLPNVEELMDPQLRRIDALLDDDAAVDEVVRALRARRPQSSRRGRPGTPAEVVLRMLVLRHLRHFSFDQLEREVTGSLVYRRFCRIDAGKVPDAKTLVRLEALVDGPVLRALLARTVERAVQERTTKGRRLRVDTTVVEAPIHYPTDSRMCEDVVRVVQRNLERLLAVGVRLPFQLRRVGRSVSRRAREIGEALRRRGDAAKEAIKKPYRGLLRITGRLLRQAALACEHARRRAARGTARSSPQLTRAVAQLERVLPLGRQVIRQARARIFRGVTDLPGKIISVFEPWAQILRRGKLHKPTEFGALVKVQEAEGGIVSDIALVPEKNDVSLLVPSVERHIQVFGRPPHLAATDRGFHSTEGERRVHELGVKRAVIPKPGRRSQERRAYEKQRWFRRGRAWRAGGEARISRLKHHFGMERSLCRGESGLERTVYWAAIANNLAAIAG